MLMLNTLLSESTMASALRLSVPILLAALGGAYTFYADVFNIALEGFMLISAFFSAVGAMKFGNPWLGVAAAVLSGLISAFLFGFLTLKLKADNIVVGLAINLGSVGLTTWLLEKIFKVRGMIMIANKATFHDVSLPLISKIPYIGPVLGRQNVLVYISLMLVVFSELFIFKHIFGIRLRAVGNYPEAAESVGVSVLKYKMLATVISGIFCGLAGAFLALGGSAMFSENMTAGKGFIALAAVFFSQGRPLLVFLASLVFGYTDAISVTLQQYGYPPQIMLILPYIATIGALSVIAIVKKSKEGFR
ncbi:MAG: ABC transporter permease [Thermotogae bacterium]|nr:ABC transporter permease [Thermotogota bacterium]